MKKMLITLLILTSLSFTYAQDVSNLSNVGQQLLKWSNNPQSKNDSTISPQRRNENELMMFILKSIADNNITDKQQKIEFVNSFQVSEDIKQFAISLINQNITYSDNEKVAYGLYLLKQCNNKSRKPNDCYSGYAPYQGSCQEQHNNECCV